MSNPLPQHPDDTNSVLPIGEDISPPLEQRLLEALDSPAREMSPDFWDQKRAELRSFSNGGDACKQSDK